MIEFVGDPRATVDLVTLQIANINIPISSELKVIYSQPEVFFEGIRQTTYHHIAPQQTTPFRGVEM